MKEIRLYVAGGILAIGVIGGIIGAIPSSDDATPSETSVAEEGIESGVDDKEGGVEKTEPELEEKPVRYLLAEQIEEVEEVKKVEYENLTEEMATEAEEIFDECFDKAREG